MSPSETAGFATVSGDAPVRVVLVGAGAMGRHWLQVITETPEVELVGLVDLDLRRLGDDLQPVPAHGAGPDEHDAHRGIPADRGEAGGLRRAHSASSLLLMA